MKKMLVIFIALALCLSMAACGETKATESEAPSTALTEEEQPTDAPAAETDIPETADAIGVCVTISCEGSLVNGADEFKVSDMDGDGNVTINDALITVHDELFDGGADAGYGTEGGAYGLSVNKLWGVENGGAYGYYVNNVSAYSLTDPLNEGDWVYAFAYADATGYSDMFTFFEERAVSAGVGEEVTLCLCGAGFDASWNPVTLTVEGAQLTVNGETIESFTDADGKVTLTFEEPGEYLVSANAAEGIIVPPVCTVTVG